MESSIFLIPGVIAGVTVGPILLLVGLIMLAASGKRENAQEAN